MMITDEQLDAFIELYKRKFGESIDRQNAYTQASKLIQLVRLTCFGKEPQPLTNKEEMVKYNSQTQSTEIL